MSESPSGSGRYHKRLADEDITQQGHGGRVCLPVPPCHCPICHLAIDAENPMLQKSCVFKFTILGNSGLAYKTWLPAGLGKKATYVERCGYGLKRVHSTIEAHLFKIQQTTWFCVSLPSFLPVQFSHLWDGSIKSNCTGLLQKQRKCMLSTQHGPRGTQ